LPYVHDTSLVKNLPNEEEDFHTEYNDFVVDPISIYGLYGNNMTQASNLTGPQASQAVISFADNYYCPNDMRIF